MKQIKITVIAFILLIGATGSISAGNTVVQKKIIWTFYNAEQDIYVEWNPGAASVAQIYLNAYDTVTTYGDDSDVEYHPENGGFLYFNSSYMISVNYGTPQHFNMVLERLY